MGISKSVFAAVTATLCVGTAAAQGWYVSGSGGVNFQVDSDNSGETGAFTTGNLGDGTTLDFAAGAALGWETDFDTGFVLSAEGGFYSASGIRLGLELSYNEAGVDSHTDVLLGDAPIGALDAAALAGSEVPLNLTVADLVADGQGDISQVAIFANAYYDFDFGTVVSPYVGAGLGIAFVDVDFSPSAVEIIDENETAFAYQLMAGLNYALTDNFDLFTEYAFRGTPDVTVDIDLFPGELEVENRQHLISAGLRFKFS